MICSIGLQISVIASSQYSCQKTFRRSLPFHILGHLVGAHEQKAQCAYIMHQVGIVDRCGYGGQQKGTFVMLVDHISQFEAY